MAFCWCVLDARDLSQACKASSKKSIRYCKTLKWLCIWPLVVSSRWYILMTVEDPLEKLDTHKNKQKCYLYHPCKHRGKGLGWKIQKYFATVTHFWSIEGDSQRESPESKHILKCVLFMLKTAPVSFQSCFSLRNSFQFLSVQPAPWANAMITSAGEDANQHIWKWGGMS